MVEIVITCSIPRALLEKYVLLFCTSPNKYLYSANCIPSADVQSLKIRLKYTYHSKLSSTVSLLIWNGIYLEIMFMNVLHMVL